MKWGYKCGEGKGAYRDTREGGGETEGDIQFWEKYTLFLWFPWLNVPNCPSVRQWEGKSIILRNNIAPSWNKKKVFNRVGIHFRI